MNEFFAIITYLTGVSKRFCRDLELEEILKAYLRSTKERYLSIGDQQKAKEIWCYEAILSVQGLYLSAFDQMKQKRFYDAWGTLERVEIETYGLCRHLPNIGDDIYKLEFIEKHTKQFQSLYPYIFFSSPGFIVHEKKCSICNQAISLRSPCGHKKGEIYNGQMCYHEITKAEFLEISLVTDPVQKYSVVFLQGENGKIQDHYNYDLVEYVITGLNHPFVSWNIKWTKIRHPHSLFPNVAETDKCPCESGKLYKDCCLTESGVLRPHAQVTFHEVPLAQLKKIVYPVPRKNL